MSVARSVATLKRTVGGDDRHNNSRQLRLAFLGCEVLPPYGPYEHTAELFADLIASAWSSALSSSSLSHKGGILVIEVFAASASSPLLPSKDDLERFDGVILPGSFSSAYEADTPWILALGEYIQTELVANQVPTLGVCFGHQLYAHSFSRSADPQSGGAAIKCPAGPQAGRKTTSLTPSGRAFLAAASTLDNALSDTVSNKGLELFYTHGDMVQSLPPRGVSLGGNTKVPIQAALYASSPLPTEDTNTMLLDAKDGGITSSDPTVIAVTFQAHPEFASSCGVTGNKGEDTLGKIMALMNRNGDLSDTDYEAAKSDAKTSYEAVSRQSLDSMVAAGRLLKWFI